MSWLVLLDVAGVADGADDGDDEGAVVAVCGAVYSCHPDGYEYEGGEVDHSHGCVLSCMVERKG